MPSAGGLLAQLAEPGPVLGAVPGVDGAIGQRQALVRNHQVQIEIDGVAETLAARARAEGIVEAEQAGLGLLARAMAALALVGSRKPVPPPLRCFLARDFFEDDLAALAVGNLRRVHNARAVVGVDDNSVQKNKHGKGEIQLEQRFRSGKLDDPSLLIEPVEPARAQFGEPGLQGLGVGRVARGYHRPALGGGLRRPARSFHRRLGGGSLRRRRRRSHGKQRLQPRSLAEGEHFLGNLVHGVALDQAVAPDAVHRPAARVKQAQVVVDLGGRGYGRARIAGGVLLLDGDGRGEPVDEINVRLLDPLEKLARVRRQRLHVAPLPLGVDGVEGQRRFARPGNSADHRQLAMGNLAGDVLQVVGPRAADDDSVVGCVQREDTGMKLSGGDPGPSARSRAQPAILHYRPWRKRRRGRANPISQPAGWAPRLARAIARSRSPCASDCGSSLSSGRSAGCARPATRSYPSSSRRERRGPWLRLRWPAQTRRGCP